MKHTCQICDAPCGPSTVCDPCAAALKRSEEDIAAGRVHDHADVVAELDAEDFPDI